MKEYTEPQYKEDAFNCPYCEVYAHQEWRDTLKASNEHSPQSVKYPIVELTIPNWSTSTCSHCGETSFWLYDKLIYPNSSIAPLPNEDLPEDIKGDYLEARKIVNNSPRGACALLRLVLQKLMPSLGEKGKKLSDDIGNLVSKGISKDIQKALDSVRVIGNDAVHPGELDLKDDDSTAIILFKLINYIVETQISSKKEIDAIYAMLPDNKIEGIENRDKS